MNSVAIRDNQGLSERQFTPAQIDVLKQSIAKGVTDLELKLFLAVCERSGLDPFAKQIYAIVRKDHGVDKMVIQTGIDGYRAMAARTGVYAGQDEPWFDCCGNDGFCPGYPRVARVTVYKMVGGVRCPFTARAAWKEYAPSPNIDDTSMRMWKKMGHLMVSKCAEAKALRMSGLVESTVEFNAEPIDVPSFAAAEVRQVEQLPTPTVTRREPEVEPAPVAPADWLTMCPQHRAKWMKTERMKTHAHKAGESWCNRPTVIAQHLGLAQTESGIDDKGATALLRDWFKKAPSSLTEAEQCDAAQRFLDLKLPPEDAPLQGVVVDDSHEQRMANLEASITGTATHDELRQVWGAIEEGGLDPEDVQRLRAVAAQVGEKIEAAK